MKRIIDYGAHADVAIEILKVLFEVGTEKKVFFYISYLFNENCPFFINRGQEKSI